MLILLNCHFTEERQRQEPEGKAVVGSVTDCEILGEKVPSFEMTENSQI